MAARKQAEPPAETTPLAPAPDEAVGSKLHDGREREVKIDPSYVERPYSEAATDEQKAALEAAGLPL